jgi:Zn-dependent protease
VIWIILVLSMLVHELGHAVVADELGDPTPRCYGRLSLNPLRHLSAFWSVFVPALVFTASHGAWVAGAMKPMPIGYRRLTPSARIRIAVAGPALNVFLGCLLYLLWPEAARLNFLLAGVNLLPIPPLDGWRIVEACRA